MIVGPEVVTPVFPDAAGSVVQQRSGDDRDVCAYAYAASAYQWIHVPGLATFRFRSRTECVSAVPVPGVSATTVQRAFRRPVALWVLQMLDFEVLHASAVVVRGGVVAFCGVSGTGKSTIAYSLSRRGHGLWADDAVVVDVSSLPPYAAPLPFQVRLDPSASAFFGPLPVAAPTEVAPAAVTSVPIRALCVLDRVSEGDVIRTAQIPPSRAFRAVLTHAHDFALGDPERKRRLARHYLDLTSQTPVFGVRFRGGLTNLAAVLDRIETLVLEP